MAVLEGKSAINPGCPWHPQAGTRRRAYSSLWCLNSALLREANRFLSCNSGYHMPILLVYFRWQSAKLRLASDPSLSNKQWWSNLYWFWYWLSNLCFSFLFSCKNGLVCCWPSLIQDSVSFIILINASYIWLLKIYRESIAFCLM